MAKEIDLKKMNKTDSLARFLVIRVQLCNYYSSRECPLGNTMEERSSVQSVNTEQRQC